MFVEVDPNFAREIIALGGGTLKKCMQCANCSVVCPLSPDENPFPRKEMIWAQWGLKERLLRDPDVWLCYNCGDCSKYCPRDAKPGQVLNAIRARVIAEYAWPKFIGRILNRSWGFPIFVIILPALILGALIYWANPGLVIPSGEIETGKFLPVENVEIAGFVLGGLALLIGLIGLWRYWLAITDGGGMEYRVKPLENAEIEVKGSSGFMGMYFIEAFFFVLRDILYHNWFKICEANRPRFSAHLLIFYGFVALFIAAMGDVMGIGEVAGVELPIKLVYPPPWPWEILYMREFDIAVFTMALFKLIGMLGGLAVIVGSAVAIWNRLFNKQSKELGSYYDWFFLIIVFLVGITGYGVAIARLFESTATYWLYMIHLYFVFMLLVYAPYSKFAHLLYRTVAMIYAWTRGKYPKNVPKYFWEAI
jgi:quinone-modifying oxidoreductase subunit QmoC